MYLVTSFDTCIENSEEVYSSTTCHQDHRQTPVSTPLSAHSTPCRAAAHTASLSRNAFCESNTARTFLMSVSLLTLMSMLTGVFGKASNTSLSRGMRLSSPPSQLHSEQTRTALLQLHTTPAGVSKLIIVLMTIRSKELREPCHRCAVPRQRSTQFILRNISNAHSKFNQVNHD